MAYRFVHRPSEDQVQAALDREFALISDQLPAASQPVLLETSHDLRNEFNRLLDGLNYTLIPFSVFALVAAGIIVFNILTGAILGSYRQIGIMKAVGLGPRHLVAVYLAVTLAPALAGSMVGAALGSGSALVVVAIAHSTFAVPGPSATAALAAAIAVVVVLAVIGLAALVSSARAARVDVHQALVFGSPAQRGGSRRWRLGGRISPTLVLGTRDVLARPLRAALTMAAVTLAVVTLIYALDARTTLALMDQDFHQAHGDLIVYRYGGFPDASLTATLNRLPQALAVVPSENLSIEIPDAGVQADAVAMGGDASRQGYALVSGRWFSGPGEAVVSQGFLNAVRLRPGDSFTATVLRAAQSSIRLHVVGVYLDIDGFARIVRFDWRTLPAAVAGSGPHLYHVRLQRGAPIGPAVAALQDNFGYHASAVGPSLLTSVIDLLGTGLPALLLAIGLAGVFHTMLLNARERAPLIAVLKAIGMTRRQVLTMVVVTGAGLGLLGAAAGLPLGIWLTHLTGSLLAHQYQVVFPSGWTSDPSPTTAVILLVCGVTLGVLGASLPAHTAARLPVAPLLRAE
jgi:putative ABC transport system permease protein